MMRLQTILLLAVLLACPLRGIAAGKQIPRLPLSPTPFSQDAMRLTCALGEIGVHVQGGYMLFGVEMRERGGQEPVVNMKVPEGATLSDALRNVMSQMPTYTLEVVSDRMIDIYPKGAKNDARDPLNLRVGKFDFADERVDMLFNHPEAYSLELASRLLERRQGPPYPVTYPSVIAFNPLAPSTALHLQNVTVREILNAASEATGAYPADLSPLSWSSLFHPDQAWAVGGTYTWTGFTSCPRDWKNYWKPPSPNAPKP